jgi:hypothetical protein
MQRTTLAWLFAFGIAACSKDATPPETKTTGDGPVEPAAKKETPSQAIPGLRELPIPAAPGSTSPNVHVDDEGRLYLVWLEPLAQGGHALQLASHGGSGWTDARTVTQGPQILGNWADVPVLASFADGAVALAWPEEFEGETEGYAFHLSVSKDEGATFGPPSRLAANAPGSEFGFISFARHGTDDLITYWLDSRAMPSDGPMQLRSAVLGHQGKLRETAVVDDRVCECCKTSAASGELGEFVVYRNRDYAEVRDINIAGASLPAGGTAVAADGWKIEGCPVNGPAIATQGREVAVAWFSGTQPPGRVNVVFTGNPSQFGSPIRVDGGHPVGRVDLEMTRDGATLVTWMEVKPDDPELAEIRVRSVYKDGRMGTPFRVAVTASSRASGFPKAVLRGDDVIWVWTDPGERGMSKVRAAQAPLESLL